MRKECLTDLLLDMLLQTAVQAGRDKQHSARVAALRELAKITGCYPTEQPAAMSHSDAVHKILAMPSAERQRRLAELRRKRDRLS